VSLLEGVVPVEIKARQRTLITVPNAVRDARKTFHHTQGYQLTIDRAQNFGTWWSIQLSISGPERWRFDNRKYGLELVDARGQAIAAWSPWLSERITRRPLARDLAWMATAPGASSLLRVPWPALAVNRRQANRSEWVGTVQFSVPAELKGPFQLRFSQFRALKTEIPFTLRDLPLP
jgi:hypothetical protein